MGEVIYQRKERVSIIEHSENNYLVIDVTTGQEYMVDADYFRSHYEHVPEVIELDEPIHAEVWKKLEEMGLRIQQLKNRVNTVTNDMRAERTQNNELRKQLGMKRKAPYRNGRKRGSRGRNG